MKHLLFPVLVLLAAGCAVDYTETMRPVRSSLYSGLPGEALSVFDREFPDSTGGDRLLFLMEKGNLLRLAGMPEQAVPLLLEADRLSDMLRGVDLSEEVLSLLSSDLVRAYRGADYENVYINYCLAACYTMLGEPSEALVECRRVSHKLAVFNDSYSGSGRYRDDAFVRYLAGALFESSGDLDDALVAYRNSLEIYETDYAGFYGLPVPDRVKADILRLSASLPGFADLHAGFRESWPGIEWGAGADSTHGEVFVVVEESLIPDRYASTVQAWTEDRLVRIAVPAIRRHGGQPPVLVVRSGSLTEEGFLAEDLSAIAEKNLEDHAARDLVRAIARAALKTATAGAAEEIVEELTGEEEGFWSEGAGILVSLAGAASEQADLRAWLTLPARIHVARMTLPAGNRPVSVELGGAPVWSGTVDARAGGIEFLFLRSSGPGSSGWR